METYAGYILGLIRGILFQRKAAVDEKTTYRRLERWATRSRTKQDGYMNVESTVVG